MENLIVYDKIDKERELLVDRIRDNTAILSDASLKVWEYDMYEAVKRFLSGNPTLQLAVMELTDGREIDMTKELRRSKKDLEMMLVADDNVSPMDYLTPEIRACSLLLRPCSKEMIDKVVRSFMSSYFREIQDGDRDDALRIESRMGMVSVPFKSIYYIEAREKKVFIRQLDREYSMYDTLENISKILPDYFKRSHRSFIFNTRYVERVKLSDNTVYLENGISIPLARSFKAQIKEFMNGR